jgi:signal transduction histidine kinase
MNIALDLQLTAPGQPIGLAASNRLRLLATGVAFVVGVVFAVDPPLSSGLTMMFAADALVVVLATACVWLSAARPTMALFAIATVCITVPIISASSAALELIAVVVVLQATLSSNLSWRLCAGISVVSLAANDLSMRISQGQSWWSSGLLYPWILTSLAVGLGLQGRHLHTAVVELHRLREVDRDRARIDERRRIARDLHDVAAHHLTALVVRNKLARRQATFDSLDRAAAFSSTTAAEALDALRQVVGVLDGDDRAGVDAAVDNSPRTPQPTLGDLYTIIDRCSTAGLHIEFRIAERLEVRRDVGIAIVRLVQEALSNVLAHRGPGNASVYINSSENSVQVLVANPSHPRSSAAIGGVKRNGVGLIGMRERVESCGGSLAICEGIDSWTVSAIFPRSATFP